MSDLSFKSFAVAKGFALPENALTVAKSLNMIPPPPVSMRAMISTASPLTPVEPVYSTSPDGTEFSWYDQANLPPWMSPPPPDPLRQATSFEFKLWFWPTLNSSILIADALVPGGNDPNSLPFGYFAGVLEGTYTFQIIAINDFGSTSTAVQTANIAAPAAAPNINAVPMGTNTNMFRVNGTGFDAWNGQTVSVNVAAGIGGGGQGTSNTWPAPVSQGKFNINVDASGLCSNAGGGPLIFSALAPAPPNSPAAIISNSFPTSCS